jgi:hypothetical protein
VDKLECAVEWRSDHPRTDIVSSTGRRPSQWEGQEDTRRGGYEERRIRGYDKFLKDARELPSVEDSIR